MFEALNRRGFQVEFRSHAGAILKIDLAIAASELEGALAAMTIAIEEIIAGGGGEARETQRLRRTLAAIGWRKMTFVVEKRINNVPRESRSHRSGKMLNRGSRL